MNRITWTMVAALAASCAFAQRSSIDLMPANMNLRLGVNYFFEDATRDAFGNAWALGIDINQSFGLVKGAQSYLSIDWYRKSTTGTRPNMLNFMLNQRFNTGLAVDGMTSTYFFVGAGFVNLDAGKSKTVLGARGGIGINLNDSLFAEGVLLVSGDANGAKANSVGLFIGYKF